MARKKSRKQKQKKPKVQKVTEQDKLKRIESELYGKVMNYIQTIARQLKMKEEDLLAWIDQNGVEEIEQLNLDMIQPMQEDFIQSWKLYEKVSRIRDRMVTAQNKLFLKEMEQKAVELDSKVKEIELEDKFYTTLPDNEGKIHLKEKWYNELAHWEKILAKAESPRDIQIAKDEIKILKKIKYSVWLKNAPKNAFKWQQKITKAIGSVSKGIGEIGDELGKMGGGTTSKSDSQYTKNDWGFTQEEVFKDVPKVTFDSPKPSKSKKKKDNDVFGGIDVDF